MNINGFKGFENYIKDIPEEVYNEFESYIKLLEGISRITNQCICLIDFYKGKILNSSNYQSFTRNNKHEIITNLSLIFNQLHIDEQENKMIKEILVSWFNFFQQIEIEERKLYSLCYDYLLQNRLICMTMTPAFLCNEGKPWIVVCKTSVSTKKKSGNATIYRSQNSKGWRYSFISKKWIEKEQLKLTTIEQDVIRLSIQGKKEYEIGELIYRSKDGLKSIKRKMFRKMEVSNITEAVSLAIERGLV